VAAVTLEQLVKVYPGGVRAVDGLSLAVPDGQLAVLVGPSGCGKTTTLRLIAGLEGATGGSVWIDGRPVDRLAPRHRDVAMVFQHHALYPHLSVRGNLAFGLKLRHAARAEIRRRVEETAAMLGIADLLDRRPAALSGGQQQRVALGRAIVRRPKVFLLDEPLSSLDARLRARMRDEIRRLHRKLGATMIYVTHDQTEAMTLGQRVAVMHQGRIQQADDPTTLYRRPANRTVAALIGSPPMNLLDGRIETRDGRPVFCHGRLQVPVPEEWAGRLEPYVDKPITLGVRPEHLGLREKGDGANLPERPGGCFAQIGPVPFFAQALIEAVEPAGPDSYLHLNTGGQILIARVDPRQDLRPGQQVDLAVAPARDGGYVLIGERRHAPELFRDMPWSSAELWPTTRLRAEQLDLACQELDTWDDLDDLAGLNRLRHRAPHSRTAQLAKRLLNDQTHPHPDDTA